MYPKITIVTPNYNLGAYLEHTILSVIGQGYPNLEYIIIDGGSTDNSLEIIKKYEKHLAYWVSEPDGGMYEAIQKGMERSTGEIMGWLNSDDMLLPRGLFTIAEIFNTFDDVAWVQGRPASFDEVGRLVDVGLIKRWSKFHFYGGRYRWVQQESTYWRRELWEKAGGRLNTELKLAGDFDLWLRFFNHARLYTTSSFIGGFRFRTGQLSKSQYAAYEREVTAALANAKKQLTTAERCQVWVFKMIYVLVSIGYRLKWRYEVLDSYFIALLFGSPKLLHYDRVGQQFKKVGYRK